MKCASVASTSEDSSRAFREVVDRVADRMGGEAGSLAVAFASPHHAGGLGLLGRLCRERGVAPHFLGVTGETIVGEGKEVEAAPAVSLWVVRLPDSVALRPVRLTWGPVSNVPAEMTGWGEKGRTLLLLGDPFTYPADQFFQAAEKAAPGLRVVGGLASGSQRPGGNRLALDDEVFSDGAVGFALDGPVAVRTVVSQGCRPIGHTWIVTRAEENVIRELAQRPALDVLRELYEELDESDQELVGRGLHVGRVINEYQGSFGPGDFLVRNVLGADDAGGIAITDAVRVGQTVQFHVRDADSASADLRDLLARDRAAHPANPPVGGLLFSCNGRGTRLFSVPNHDARAIAETYDDVPVAGFFAMGELGPVGGKNFVHGFTASLALFADEA